MTTFNISSASELKTALAQAKGGDTILLAGGNYGALSTGNDYTSALTIKSADAGNPASFSSMYLSGATNITFDSIDFDYTYKSGDTIDVSPFEIMGSTNIAILNSTFDGDVAKGLSSVDNGYAVGRGLVVGGSNGVTIEGSEFVNWYRGAFVYESQNIDISGNDISQIRSDGLNFAQVQNVLIEYNNIHDFRAAPNSGDHGDMIQFWTSGTSAPSTGITIRGNTLDVGEGTWTQTIFMRNEVVDQGIAGASMYYQDVVIENNTIINNHTHGITVGETNGLVVQNNSLTKGDLDTSNAYNAEYVGQYGVNAGIMVPRIILSPASDDVTASNNSFYGAASFSGLRLEGYTNQSDWSVSNNGYAGLSEQNFESLIELYIAYFNRAPDAVGFNFWSTAFANGTTLQEMATLFIDQDETRATYPTSLSNAEFATAVYNNVLGRVPDQAGFDFWVGVLDTGARGRDQFILSVLDGVQDGSSDRLYLDNKVNVGAYFAVHEDMSDMENASAAMALFYGTSTGIANAVNAIDGSYTDALDPTNGELLMPLVGVLDNPFTL